MELLVRSDRDGDLALYALGTSGAPRRVVGLPLGVGPVSVSADGRRFLVDGPRLEVLTSTGEADGTTNREWCQFVHRTSKRLNSAKRPYGKTKS